MGPVCPCGMAAFLPRLGGPSRHPLSTGLLCYFDKAQQIVVVKELTADYSHSALYGRVMGLSPSRVEIRDWLQASLCLEDSHITEVALMGKGIFMLKLSTMECASNLKAHSPITVDGKILSFVAWYRGFRSSDFDTQLHIPRFLVTPLFLGSAMELRPCIPHFGANFGWAIQDTFGDAVASVGAPRIRVALHDPSLIPQILKI